MQSSHRTRCEPLLVILGAFNDIPGRELKDNDCTSNVTSRHFVSAHRDKFVFRPILRAVRDSKAGLQEIASKVVVNGTLCIGFHHHTGDWIVADARFDILLGMP